MFFFSSRRRHTRLQGDWSSDVCSSDLVPSGGTGRARTIDRVGGETEAVSWVPQSDDYHGICSDLSESKGRGRPIDFRAKGGLTFRYEDSNRQGLLRDHDLGESNEKDVETHRGIPQSVQRPERKPAGSHPLEYETGFSTRNIERRRKRNSARAHRDLTRNSI